MCRQPIYSPTKLNPATYGLHHTWIIYSPRQQFEYLRNIMNGYALAMEKYPEWFEDRKSESKMVWSTFYSQDTQVVTQKSSKDELEMFFNEV